MNRGTSQSLELLGQDGQTEWTVDLQEDGDPGDEDAYKYRLAVPPFHGYSADGDATGQLIYADYGQKEVSSSRSNHLAAKADRDYFPRTTINSLLEVSISQGRLS